MCGPCGERHQVPGGCPRGDGEPRHFQGHGGLRARLGGRRCHQAQNQGDRLRAGRTRRGRLRGAFEDDPFGGGDDLRRLCAPGRERAQGCAGSRGRFGQPGLVEGDGPLQSRSHGCFRPQGGDRGCGLRLSGNTPGSHRGPRRGGTPARSGRAQDQDRRGGSSERSHHDGNHAAHVPAPPLYPQTVDALCPPRPDHPRPLLGGEPLFHQRLEGRKAEDGGHEHPGGHRERFGLLLFPPGHVPARDVLGSWLRAARLLRWSGHDHHPGAPGAFSRDQGPGQDLGGHQKAHGPGAQDGSCHTG